MPISFNLAGEFQGTASNPDVLNNPTALAFGPDGRLYVTEQNGQINVFTVELQSGTYVATAHEELVDGNGNPIVRNIQNHFDDGSESAVQNRQVTGIVTAGTALEPILYISSSNPEIAQEEGEKFLDTNSGVITKATWNATTSEWEVVDLVRGLPRSEENHAVNGMLLSEDGTKLLVHVGGATNAGAPSFYFSNLAEYALGAALLELDLAALDALPTLIDADGGQGNTARAFKYDLPTLDDPNIPNVTDGVGEDAFGMDEDGPWGGNDGLNQAILPSNAPLRVYADGLRNAYDLTRTPDGKIYTVDNGGNSGIGAGPVAEVGDEDGDGILGEATNGINEGGINDPEPLYSIVEGTYYGHPNPVRSNQNMAWTVYGDDGLPDPTVPVNVVPDISALVPTALTSAGLIQSGFLIDPSKYAVAPGMTLADLTPQEQQDRLFEGGIRVPPQSNDSLSIVNVGSSTNGIVAYDSGGAAFDSVLDGKLIITQFNDNVTLLNINAAGTGLDPVMEEGPDGIFGTADDVVQDADGILFIANTNLGVPLTNPLDVTMGPDGTLWVAEIGSDDITVLAPSIFLPPIDLDSDDDGILNVDDPFMRDAANGTSLQLQPGTTYLWDFDANQDGNRPGPDGFGGGLTGVMIDNVTDFEAFLQSPSPRPGQTIQADNVKFITAAGGGTTIVESVSQGDTVGSTNSGEFLFHTGVSLDSTVESLNIAWSVGNPGAEIIGQSQQIGGYIGTGDQSNYLRLTAIGGTTDEFRIILEDNDIVLSDQSYDSGDVFNPSDIPVGGEIEFELDIDVVAGIATPVIRYDTLSGQNSFTGAAPIDLTGTAVLDAILGNYSVQGQSSGLAVGLFSTNAGQLEADTFQALFDDITITAVGPAFPPVATDDALSSTVNQVLAIPVTTLLANDTDANGDPLSITSVSNFTNGTGTLDDNGTPGDSDDDFVSFTPATDFVGTATFDYEVSDGALTDTGTVSVDVLDPTVIYRVNAGGTEVAALANDPYGSTMAWAANDGNNVFVGDGFSVNTGRNSTQNVTGRATTGDYAVPDYAPQALFVNERYDRPAAPEMVFEFGEGQLAAGTYTVNLFAGNGFSGTDLAGERIFSVMIEGQTVTDWGNSGAIDLVALLGHDTGGMFSWTGTVDDGTLDIEWVHDVENPLVNAIEVISGGSTTPAPAVISIADPTPSSVVESGDVGNTTLVFPVTFDKTPASPITVSYDVDINGVVTSGSAALGTSNGSISVDVANDDLENGPEAVSVTLTGVTVGAGDAELGTAISGAGTVTEDDVVVAPAVISIADPTPSSVVESGDVGNTTLVFPVTFDKTPASPITVSYDVDINGVVTSGSAALGTSNGSISVDVANDDLENGPEAVSVTLTGVTVGAGDAELGTAITGAGTVTEDDGIGSADLSINATSNNIQQSSFASNSFQIFNSGQKQITQVEIDISSAVFFDTVFDPFGLAGDDSFKAITIDSGGTLTGAVVDNGTAQAPGSSFVGTGGIDGYKSIVIDFGDFDPGETIGLSVDVDSNAIAGSEKDTLNSGTVPNWDSGGVSGAELIGSTFTATFDDGTSAVGYLHAVGNQAGSKGHATTAVTGPGSFSLEANGLQSGEVGTYETGGPNVSVIGTSGQVARVVVVKGLIQPLNNNFDPSDPYFDQLNQQLAALTGSSFPANNAVEFQTVDVTLTGFNQDISDLFDFTEVAVGEDLSGHTPEDQVPLAILAGLIDTANNDFVFGPISDPIYLTFDGGQSPAVISIADPTPSSVVESGDVGNTTLVFPVTFDKTPASPITVSYDVDINGVVTSGSAALGTSNGSISVDVANDDLENGPEAVSVTLTGVTVGAGDAELGTAITGAGTVTEDDGTATVLYRVNAGGTEVAALANDPYGSTMAWAANDKNNVFVGDGFSVNTGRNSTQNVTGRATTGDYAVPDYAPQALFVNERYDRPAAPEMVFEFGEGQLAAGTYTVNLFAGNGFSGTDLAGERIFSVMIEGQTVTDWGNSGAIDLVALLGHDTGGMFSWTGTVDDGTLDIEWVHDVENPLVNAIEILDPTIDNLV